MCSPIKISQITGQPIPNSHRESHNVAGTFPYVSFESDDSEVDEEITGEPDASETHCQLILSKIKLLIEPQVKECAQLKEQLRKSNRKCEDLHRKCAEQAEEIKSLKETITSLKVELEYIVKQRVFLLAEKDWEIEKHEEEEVRLTKRLRVSDQEINRHIEEIGRLKRDHNKRNEQLEAKVAFAASQLEAEKTKHKDTKQKLEDSEREKSIAEEMRLECQEKIQKLEGDLDEERALNIQLSQTVQSLEDERASNTQLSQANESLGRQVKQLQKELRLKDQKLEESLAASRDLTHKLSRTADPQDQEDLETDGCGGVQQLNMDVLSTSRCEETARLCPISLPAVIEFHIEMAPRWEAIGHCLFIESSAIQSLRNHPCTQESKCIQMLEKWFDNGRDVSWERLFSALRGQKMMSLISAMHLKNCRPV